MKKLMSRLGISIDRGCRIQEYAGRERVNETGAYR